MILLKIFFRFSISKGKSQVTKIFRKAKRAQNFTDLRKTRVHTSGVRKPENVITLVLLDFKETVSDKKICLVLGEYRILKH